MSEPVKEVDGVMKTRSQLIAESLNQYMSELVVDSDGQTKPRYKIRNQNARERKLQPILRSDGVMRTADQQAMFTRRSNDSAEARNAIHAFIKRTNIDRKAGYVAPTKILATASKIPQYGWPATCKEFIHSPLDVVTISGGDLDLFYISDSNQCGSLIWMSYARQSAGTALINVLFGNYNPGGRLPITYYPASYLDQVPESDIQMRPSSTNPGLTYKCYTGKPVFEFGYGLSYTTFSYSWNNQTTNSIISIESLLKNTQENIHIHLFHVNVTNTGEMEGNDIVLAFAIPSQKSLSDIHHLQDI